MRCSESPHCCVTTKQAQSSEKEADLSYPFLPGSVHPLASGTATNRVASAVFTRIRTLCLPVLAASQRASHVADIGDGLAADIENDVAGLEAVLRRGPLRIDGGDHDALSAGALDVARRAQGGGRDAARRAFDWRLAFGIGLTVVRHFAKRQRHASWLRPCAGRRASPSVPGAIMLMVRARSRQVLHSRCR